MSRNNVLMDKNKIRRLIKQCRYTYTTSNFVEYVYREQIEADVIIAKCGSRRQMYCLFQWCVLEEVREAVRNDKL